MTAKTLRGNAKVIHKFTYQAIYNERLESPVEKEAHDAFDKSVGLALEQNPTIDDIDQFEAKSSKFEDYDGNGEEICMSDASNEEEESMPIRQRKQSTHEIGDNCLNAEIMFSVRQSCAQG